MKNKYNTPPRIRPVVYRRPENDRRRGLREDAATLTKLLTMSISELEALIDSKLPSIRKGDIVNGTILEIRPQVVLVDIGYKSEGVISISEFEDEEIEVGDQIEVLLESLEND